MIRRSSIKALLTPQDIDVSPVLVKSKRAWREAETAKQTHFSYACKKQRHSSCSALKCTCECHSNEVGR